MNRQLEMRVERRIRMWILEQELERQKTMPHPAPTSPASRNRAG
jgi:hypothetical protein